jgi:hypothetical protein
VPLWPSVRATSREIRLLVQDNNNKVRTVPLWPSETTNNNQQPTASDDHRYVLQEWKCCRSHHTGSRQQNTDSGIVAIRNNTNYAKRSGYWSKARTTTVDSVNMTIDNRQCQCDHRYERTGTRPVLPAAPQEWIFESEAD